MQYFSQARRARERAAGWVFACLLTVSGRAYAQVSDDTTIAAARQLGQAGVALYTDGDIPGALEKLQRAYALYPVPSLGLWYGRALERAGRLMEASERYREVSRAVLPADATAAFRQATTDAKTALDAVSPRIPQLTIEAPGVDLASVRVTLDEVALPAAALGVAIPVNPGAHVLRAVLGTQSIERQLALREAEPCSITLDFPPEPPSAPPGSGKSRLSPLRSAQTAEAALPRDQIFKVMQAMQPEINACGRGSAGKAVVSLSIRGSTGRVENVKVKLDQQSIAQLVSSPAISSERIAELYESCMLRVVENARFPQFSKPVLEVQYPFRFAPSLVRSSNGERAHSAAR